MSRAKSSPASHRPSPEPATCQKPLPFTVCPAICIARVRRLTTAKPEGFSRVPDGPQVVRSEEHTSELQSLMRISYAVFCLQKKKNRQKNNTNRTKSNN